MFILVSLGLGSKQDLGAYSEFLFAGFTTQPRDLKELEWKSTHYLLKNTCTNVFSILKTGIWFGNNGQDTILERSMGKTFLTVMQAGLQED